MLLTAVELVTPLQPLITQPLAGAAVSVIDWLLTYFPALQVGELVGGLNKGQIEKLVADGVIQEVKTAAATTKKITGDAK